MAELPSGTVTFLFTDVEGSTRLTQALGDAWPPLLQRHLAILSDAIAAQGGTIFGTEGDAVFAVFPTAPRAAAAALDAQRALAAEPWPEAAAIRVRMGLHTGEGTVSGGSYVGIDVHRVARIASAGHGGQVLISAATRMLAEASLPDGATITDLGEHRLKDLSRPEHIAMLVGAGLPDSFPPLKTLDAVPNNLPTQLTTFLGREHELAQVTALLAESRLLTLTGPGGTGKTRLALQLAADVTDQYLDGVYFVPLGTIGEASLVLPTIAQALGLPDPGGHALERLAEQLGSKRVLFVLDNFEQVIEAAPQVADLLARLPNARVLATSRSALRVYGEQEYPVPPLGLPDPKHLPAAESLSQYASVALFIERAMSVQPGFHVDASNAPAIAEVCVRLDGLPLAIELAAARVRVLTPQAILSRLGDRLSLLAGGSRDLPERQQTLRGAIDWSYDLLDEDDRLSFARFSVFAGGADLAAVELVALADWPAAARVPDALDAVTSLLDKSLVRQVMTDDEEPRFRMLGTIREYAAERLAEREPDGATRRRHAQHYLALAEGAASRLFGPDQRALLDTLETEHDNLRAAIVFAIDGNEAELALRLLAAGWRFWQMRGYLPEARERAERILAMPDAERHPEARLRALDAAGGIAYWQGDMAQAIAWYREEAAVAHGLDDGKAEAEAIYNQAMSVAIDLGKREDAKRLAHDALQRFRDLGDRGGEGRALWAITNTAIFDTDPGEMVGPADETIGIFREVGDSFMLAWALYTSGLMRIQLRDWDRARADLSEAVSIFAATNDVSGYALVLDGFASLEWREGDQRRAMRLAGAAGALQDVTGIGLARRNRDITEFYPDQITDPILVEAYAQGKSLSPQEAVRLALREDEP